MKKILSAFLAVIMIFASFAVSAYAEDGDDVTAVNATYTYDEHLDAVAITPVVPGETSTVSFDLSDVPTATAYTAIMLPYTAADETLDVTINGTVATLHAGHKFEVCEFALDSSSVEISFTANADYTLYLFDEFDVSAELVNDRANRGIAEYSEDYLNLDHYDVDRYTKPFWDGGVVFNESFFAITEPDGSVAPIELMYNVDRVISVKNFYLKTEYVYGKDYTIEDGKLIINPEGSILVHLYSDIFKGRQVDSSYRKTLDGAYAYCGQVPTFLKGYLNITYYTDDEWDGVVPEKKGQLLPNFTEKINTPGETIKILSIGDSLAGGANASADMNVAPYAEIWRDMVPSALQLLYPDVTIERNTIAQGGATASLAIERMQSILAYAPDIIFIEFGTNECMNGDDPFVHGGYIDTLVSAINSINTNLPECDIVLVAPIISNPIFFPTDWFYKYADSLYTLEREGVAVADSTSYYQYMMSRKRYIDMSGDFLCHPSDFGTRLFVQSILKALEPSTDAELIAGYAERITKYRYANEFNEAEWNQITALMAEGKTAIASCATLDAARSTYLNYAAQIDVIPTAAELMKAATIDPANLVFDTQRKTEAIFNNVNANVRFSETDPAAVVTATHSRNCSFYINYAAGETPVSADDYNYLVITCYVPATNSTRSNSTIFTFNVGEGEGTALAGDTVTHIRDGKYHSYVINLSEKAGFTGEIVSLKSNLYNPINLGDELYISSVILCEDAQTAEDVAIEREYAANKTDLYQETTLMVEDNVNILKCDEVITVLGDGDNSDTVTAKDMHMLRSYLADLNVTIANPDALDMDRDGALSMADEILLRKTLSGNIELADVKDTPAEVKYDAVNEAAEITLLKDNGSVKVDLDGMARGADYYRYLSVCAKTADGSAVDVDVILTTSDNEYTRTVTIPASEFFNADTAKFTDASGALVSVEFVFRAEAGTVIYFDSFVLTPTVTMAHNAETVRIGAANLI